MRVSEKLQGFVVYKALLCLAHIWLSVRIGFINNSLIDWLTDYYIIPVVQLIAYTNGQQEAEDTPQQQLPMPTTPMT